MPVKFGTVHAGKAHLTADSKTAAAAHACTVNHDGVHADGAGSIPAGSQVTDCLHHGQRTDGKHHIEPLARLQKLLQRAGDKSLFSGGAVIAAQQKTVAGVVHFPFQNDLLSAAETGNGSDTAPLTVQGCSSRQGDGAAQTPADDGSIAIAFDVAGTSQRTGKGR